MKKLLTTLCVAAAASTAFAVNVVDQITWCNGTSYSTKTQLVNMTAPELAYLYGVFTDGQTLVVESGQKAEVTGPSDFNKSRTIYQAKQYNSSTGEYDLQPAFYVEIESISYIPDGVYTVSFPAGAFTVDGEPNDAFSVQVTQGNQRTYTPIDIEWSYSPDPAVPVEELSEFKFTMSNRDGNDKQLYSNRGVSGKTATVTRDGGNAVEVGISTTSTFQSKLAYKLDIEAGTFTEAGTYTISVPEGVLQLESESGSAYYTNAAFSVEYTVTGSGEQPGTTVDVKDMVTWYNGQSFTTKQRVLDNRTDAILSLFGMFEGGQTVKVNYDPNLKAEISGPNSFSMSATITQCQTYVNDEYVDQPGFKFTVSAYGQETEGLYTITIPAGVLTVDGSENEAFTWNLTVKDETVYTPIELDWVANPDPGITQESIEWFDIRFTNVDSQDKRIYRNLGPKDGAKGTVTMVDGETTTLEFKSDGMANQNEIAYKLVFPEGFAFTKEGTYIVNIPEGCVQLETETGSSFYTNKELTYTYTVGGGQPSTEKYTSTRPSIIPAEGDIYAFAGIRMETLDGYSIAPAASAGVNVPFTLTLPDGSAREIATEGTAANYYIFARLDEILTEAGTYTVTVPKGSFAFINDNSGELLYTEGFTLTYNLKGGEETELPYKLETYNGDEVVDGASVYQLDYIFVEFEEAVTPTAVIRAKVTDPEGNVSNANITYSAANERFMIDLGFPSVKGKYNIVFPAAAAATASGQLNKEIAFTINFMEKKTEEIACTTNPENGSTVKSLLALYIQAPDGITELSRYRGGITMTYFYNDDDTENRQMQYLAETGDPTRLMITLDEEVTEIGDYTWEIPANSIVATKADGTQVLCTGMNFFWSIREAGAVEGIMGDAETATIYDLNGTCIARNAGREAVRSLKAGVYVINGRTFILK